MEFVGRKRLTAELNIAPLVDVVFLLLLFFMLTSTMITQEALELNLPDASSATVVEEQESISISIDKKGAIFLNQKELSLFALIADLKARSEKAKQDGVILRVDSEVRMERFVEVMDQIKGVGIQRVSVATERQK